jgi:primary-amine oxidase
LATLEDFMPLCRFGLPFAVILALLSAAWANAEDRVPAPTRTTHPMDALTAVEITAATTILRNAGKLPDGALVVSMTLEEPSKAEVRGWVNGEAFSRRAFAVVLTDGKLAEAKINLDARTLSAWDVIENRQAAITIDEIIAVGSILGSDAGWREAMGKRGFISLANVFCFPFSAGPSLDPALAGRRVLKSSCVDRTGASNNIWGKPVENLMATIDLTERKVVSITDLGVLPAPPDTPSHAWKDSGQVRPVTRPVEIASAQGSNITVTGGEVRWDNWSFHVRLDPRLGAVLSLIRYDDHGLAREIVYQLSASEMFVPYMDPASTWSFRGYMDIGEYGFGVLATQLRPGLDCPAGASFLDVTIADTKGAPLGLKGVVCIFERPTGNPLWRHEEAVNQTYEARANTELVVRMAPVVGNYDYLVDYVFDRAGDIDVRLGAYGIDETKGVASSTLSDPTATADTAYGTLVGNRLVAVNHDHYMAFRIDMDVDGPANRFVEDRIVPRRISENGPRRSLWQVESRATAVEGPVTTPINAAQFRVESTTKKNALGYPTSYQLMPGHTDSSILSPDDALQIRAGFSAYTMWSSAYAPHELYAAGAYPNENPEVDGLPKWVSAKRPIDGKDLVLWYTIGFRHVPRAEDWPAMPGLWHGFRLRPFNFFDRSPALDVPPAQAAAK